MPRVCPPDYTDRGHHIVHRREACKYNAPTDTNINASVRKHLHIHSHTHFVYTRSNLHKHLMKELCRHRAGCWPEPCTVFDRIIGDFPVQNTVYTPNIYIVLANPWYCIVYEYDPGRPCKSKEVKGKDAVIRTVHLRAVCQSTNVAQLLVQLHKGHKERERLCLSYHTQCVSPHRMLLIFPATHTHTHTNTPTHTHRDTHTHTQTRTSTNIHTKAYTHLQLYTRTKSLSSSPLSPDPQPRSSSIRGSPSFGRHSSSTARCVRLACVCATKVTHY